MNKIIHDLLPAIVFFTVYKTYDIFFATTALIIVTLSQLIWEYIIHRKVSKIQIIIAILVVIFGSSTLYFHNEEFIKWKVSIINWLIGISLIITTYSMKETPIQRMLNKTINLKDNKWKKLNSMWGAYFTILGTLNLFIAYFFSTNIWMNFKLFGILGITFIFVIIQLIYLSKHVKK